MAILDLAQGFATSLTKQIRNCETVNAEERNQRQATVSLKYHGGLPVNLIDSIIIELGKQIHVNYSCKKGEAAFVLTQLSDESVQLLGILSEEYKKLTKCSLKIKNLILNFQEGTLLCAAIPKNELKPGDEGRLKNKINQRLVQRYVTTFRQETGLVTLFFRLIPLANNVSIPVTEEFKKNVTNLLSGFDTTFCASTWIQYAASTTVNKQKESELLQIFKEFKEQREDELILCTSAKKSPFKFWVVKPNPLASELFWKLAPFFRERGHNLVVKCELKETFKLFSRGFPKMHYKELAELIDSIISKNPQLSVRFRSERKSSKPIGVEIDFTLNPA